MANNFSDIVYHSLDTILEFLKKPENFSLEPVRQAVAIYERVRDEETSKHTAEELYPLIVLEGLDGSGKSTLTKRLSKNLCTELWSTPPKCLKEIRPTFDLPEYKHLRPAFYSLGNYIAALEMKTILQRRSIVLDRFWHSTSAYAIAQAIEDSEGRYSLPEANDPIYAWPKDLLLPTKIFFLSVSEKVRLQRMGGRKQLTNQEHLIEARQQFRANIFSSYQRMFDPKVIFINGNPKKQVVEKNMLTHLEHEPLLQETVQSILSAK